MTATELRAELAKEMGTLSAVAFTIQVNSATAKPEALELLLCGAHKSLWRARELRALIERAES